jgi:hypothetical protein
MTPQIIFKSFIPRLKKEFDVVDCITSLYINWKGVVLGGHC